MQSFPYRYVSEKKRGLCRRQLCVKRETGALRDERERRDTEDRRENYVMHRLMHDVRGSKFQKPRTSDLEPSPVHQSRLADLLTRRSMSQHPTGLTVRQ